MITPRDRDRRHRIGPVRLARIYSNVVSPPVMFALLGLALALHQAGAWPGLGWAAAYGFLVSLLPILFVLFLLRTGRISELHMSHTGERHLPYVAAIASALLMLALVVWLDGPELLRCLTLFNVIELSALAVVNVFWLISLHATGIMATMVIVWLVFGGLSGLLLLPLVVSVVWVRLFLRRHTPGQVVAGLVLGVVSVLSLTAIGCF